MLWKYWIMWMRFHPQGHVSFYWWLSALKITGRKRQVIQMESKWKLYGRKQMCKTWTLPEFGLHAKYLQMYFNRKMKTSLSLFSCIGQYTFLDLSLSLWKWLNSGCYTWFLIVWSVHEGWIPLTMQWWNSVCWFSKKPANIFSLKCHLMWWWHMRDGSSSAISTVNNQSDPAMRSNFLWPLQVILLN